MRPEPEALETRHHVGVPLPVQGLEVIKGGKLPVTDQVQHQGAVLAVEGLGDVEDETWDAFEAQRPGTGPLPGARDEERLHRPLRGDAQRADRGLEPEQGAGHIVVRLGQQEAEPAARHGQVVDKAEARQVIGLRLGHAAPAIDAIEQQPVGAAEDQTEIDQLAGVRVQTRMGGEGQQRRQPARQPAEGTAGRVAQPAVE